MKKYLFLLLCLISLDARAVLYYDITGGCTNLWCRVLTEPGVCCPAESALSQSEAFSILNEVAAEQNSVFVGITSKPVEVLQTSKSESEVSNLVINKAGTVVDQGGMDSAAVNGLYVAMAAKCENDDTCSMTVADSGAVTYSPKSSGGNGGCASDEQMVGSGTASATCVPNTIMVYGISYDLAEKGKISVANPTDCQSGETVYLPDVTAIDGWNFVSWSGDGGTNKAGAAIKCNQNKSFTANYEAEVPRTTEQPKWITISLGNTDATTNGSPILFVCQINSKYTEKPYGCYTSQTGTSFTKMTKTPVRNTFVYKGHYVGKRQIISSSGSLTSGWKYLTTNASAEPLWEEKTIIVSYASGNCNGTLAPTDQNLQCTVGGSLSLPNTANLAGTNQVFNHWIYNSRTATGATTSLTCTRGRLGGIAGSTVQITANCSSTSGTPTWHKVTLQPGGSGVTQGTPTVLCCDEKGLYSGWYSGGTNGTCNSGNQLSSITKPGRTGGYSYQGAKLDGTETLLIDANGTINNVQCSASLPTSATAQWVQDGSGYYNPDDETVVHLNFTFECDDGSCPTGLIEHAQNNIAGVTGVVPRGDYCFAGDEVHVNNCFITMNNSNPYYKAWRCDGHVVNGVLKGASTSYTCPDTNTDVIVKYHSIPALVNINYVVSCASSGDEFCPNVTKESQTCTPGETVLLFVTGNLNTNTSEFDNAFYQFTGFEVDGQNLSGYVRSITCPDNDLTVTLNFTQKDEPAERWVTFNLDDTLDASMRSQPDKFYCQMNDGIRNCPKGCHWAPSCDAESFTGLSQVPVRVSGLSYDGHSKQTNPVISKILNSYGQLTGEWDDSRLTDSEYDIVAQWKTTGIAIEYDKGNCTGELTTQEVNRFCGEANGYVSLPATGGLAGTDQVFVGWKNTNGEWVTSGNHCTSSYLGASQDGTATLTAVCESHRWRTVELGGASNIANKWICCDELADSSAGVVWYQGGLGATANCGSQITKNEQARKDGYVFGGFKFNDTNTFFISPDGSFNSSLTCDDSLGSIATAQWNIGFTWNYDCGANPCPSNALDGFQNTCTPGTSLTVECNNVSGYTCGGWVIDDVTKSVGDTVACSDLLSGKTITVKYQPATAATWATVTLDDSGAEVISSPNKFYCQTTPNIDDCSMGCRLSQDCSEAIVIKLDTIPRRAGYTYHGHYISGEENAFIDLSGGEAMLWSSWNALSTGENVAKARWVKDYYNMTATCGSSCTSISGGATSVAPGSAVYLRNYCEPGANQQIVWTCSVNYGTRTEPYDDNLAEDTQYSNSWFNMPKGDISCTANCVIEDNSTTILNLRPFTLGGN